MRAGGCSPGAALLAGEAAASAASVMLPVSSFQPFLGWRLISGTSPITFQITGFLTNKVGAISCRKNCCQATAVSTEQNCSTGWSPSLGACKGHRGCKPPGCSCWGRLPVPVGQDGCSSLGTASSLGWARGVPLSCPAAACRSRSVELALTAGSSLVFPGLLSCRYSSELCCQLEKFCSQVKPKQPKSCSVLRGAWVGSICIFSPDESHP